jgi:hypothetical protein
MVNVYSLLLLLGIQKGRGYLPYVWLRVRRDGNGRGPEGKRMLLVENVIVFCAVILYKVSVSVGGFYAFVTRPFLRRLYTFGLINNGDKVMPEIVYADCLRISARLSNAALDIVPDVAGGNRHNPIASPLIVANKKRRRTVVMSTINKVTSYGFPCSAGNLYNRLLVALPGYDGSVFHQINVSNSYAASLRDAQTTVSQEQDKSLVSKVYGTASYSIHIINSFLYALHVGIDYVLRGLEGITLVRHLEKGCVDAWGSVGGKVIQSLDGRSTEGLRGWVHVGGLAKEFYIGIFRELRVIANDLQKRLESLLVCRSGLFTARLIHEIQIVRNSLLHSVVLSLSNANYIRK